MLLETFVISDPNDFFLQNLAVVVVALIGLTFCGAFAAGSIPDLVFPTDKPQVVEDITPEKPAIEDYEIEAYELQSL